MAAVLFLATTLDLFRSGNVVPNVLALAYRIAVGGVTLMHEAAARLIQLLVFFLANNLLFLKEEHFFMASGIDSYCHYV